MQKNILVNINKNFVKYFLAMINSLAINNENSKFDVYIMHSNLDDSDKEIIKTHIKENVNPIYIKMDNSLFKGAPKVKRYPYEIYYRIFAPIMLPETVDKILYLDSDMIVHKNIDELYNTDFEGNLFVACTQIRAFMQWFNRVRLTASIKHVYINTGVMLMNVKELRNLVNQEKIFKFIKRNGWRMCLYDEDVIFKFWGDRVRLVDAKLYNCGERTILFHNLQRKNKKNKIDLDWVEKNNVIIHYLGKNKPWKANYKGIMGDYYKKYEVNLDNKK